jgi:hypothetical protein
VNFAVKFRQNDKSVEKPSGISETDGCRPNPAACNAGIVRRYEKNIKKSSAGKDIKTNG